MLGVTLLLGCSNPQMNARLKAKEIREEVEVGRAIAAKLLGKFKLDETNPQATDYIQVVGTHLANQFGRPELTYRFAIVKEGPVNAYACPGGFIFLSRKLVDRLQSEDELVGILGHEIAHVNLNHVYGKIRKPKDVSAGATLSRILSQGGGDMAYAFSEAITVGLKMLTDDGLGPIYEGEADEQALTYSTAGGFDPGALYRFLSRTSDAQVGLPKSHPALNERLKKIESWLISQTRISPQQKREPASRTTRFQRRMKRT
jgi:predicted Zn-dependent protease